MYTVKHCYNELEYCEYCGLLVVWESINLYFVYFSLTYHSLFYCHWYTEIWIWFQSQKNSFTIAVFKCIKCEHSDYFFCIVYTRLWPFPVHGLSGKNLSFVLNCLRNFTKIIVLIVFVWRNQLWVYCDWHMFWPPSKLGTRRWPHVVRLSLSKNIRR